MFEYLMPVIWMKSHPNTLLDRSMRSAVRAQQSYATRRAVPWGISEAAFSKTDEQGNYQYAAFGVPGPDEDAALAGTQAGDVALADDEVGRLGALVDDDLDGAGAVVGRSAGGDSVACVEVRGPGRGLEL